MSQLLVVTHADEVRPNRAIASTLEETAFFDQHRGPMATYPSPEQPRAVFLAPPEETLIDDARAGLSPAQMVERKLIGLLKHVPLPLSQIMTRPRGR